MKGTIIIVLFILSSSVFGQPGIKKIYAYYRDVLPGIQKVTIDDKGNTVEEKPDIRREYFIYAETKNNIIPVITKLFINGKKISAKTDPVNKLPVLLYKPHLQNKMAADTLVGTTTNYIWKISVSVPGNQKEIAAPSKYRDFQLLVIYVYRKKQYILPLRSMKQLEPLAMM